MLADNKNAEDNDIYSSDNWFNYIIQKDEDSVANSIISLAKRYDLKIEKVAREFGPQMLIRTSKIIENKNNAKIKK